MKKTCKIIGSGILIGLVLLLLCSNALAEHPVDPNLSRIQEHLQRLEEGRKQREAGIHLRGETDVSIEISGTVAPSQTLTFTATPDAGDPETVRYEWYVIDEGRDPSYTCTYYPIFPDGTTGNDTMSYFFYSAGTYSIYVQVYQDSEVFEGGGDCYAWGWYDFAIRDDGVHPTIEDKIAEVVQANRGSTDWETALNLHEWVTHNAYYDDSLERHGADMIFSGLGVCDSYSKEYKLLLDAAGVPVHRAISAGHAWNVIRIGDEWSHVDATWDDPGDATVPVSGYESHDYFCINDELIQGLLDQSAAHSKGYEWEGTNASACTSLDASYPIHTEEWREYGKYLDENDGTIKDYKDLILSSAGGETAFSVEAIHYYPMGGNSYAQYWREDTLLRRYYYAYGLSKTGIELDTGELLEADVSFNLDASDPKFTGTISGSAQIPDEDIIILPDDLTTIEDEAFAGVQARKVEIGATVTSIGCRAFADIAGILYADFADGSNIEIHDRAFENTNVIILCYENSSAYNYATEKNIPYMLKQAASPR